MTLSTIGYEHVNANFRARDAKVGQKGLPLKSKQHNFGITLLSIEPMHLNVRRLVGKRFKRKHLQDGVTFEELDNVVENVIFRYPLYKVTFLTF